MDGVGREFDAIVLAGGAARRLGGADKPGLDICGTSLLDRVLSAVADARQIVCVGPPRPVAGRTPTWRLEQPPGSGPVSAITAALPETSAGAVLVLAADLPWIAPAVPALLAALAESASSGAALLADPGGRVNLLAGAWRRSALDEALRATGDHVGASMKRLVEHVRLVTVPDPEGWGRDCDTWDDIDAARRQTTEEHG